MFKYIIQAIFFGALYFFVFKGQSLDYQIGAISFILLMVFILFQVVEAVLRDLSDRVREIEHATGLDKGDDWSFISPE